MYVIVALKILNVFVTSNNVLTLCMPGLSKPSRVFDNLETLNIEIFL